jgi:hypothetical protein
LEVCAGLRELTKWCAVVFVPYILFYSWYQTPRRGMKDGQACGERLNTRFPNSRDCIGYIQKSTCITLQFLQPMALKPPGIETAQQINETDTCDQARKICVMSIAIGGQAYSDVLAERPDAITKKFPREWDQLSVSSKWRNRHRASKAEELSAPAPVSDNWGTVPMRRRETSKAMKPS